MSADGRQTRFDRLHAIGRRLHAARDLDAVLAVVTEEVAALLDADRATLFVYDRERDELFSRVATALEIAEIRLPAGTGAVGIAARTLEPVRIADAAADPRWSPLVDERTGYRTRSLLCVPLLDTKKELLGVIQALNKDGGGSTEAVPFTPEDEGLVAIIAAYAGVTLENAALAEEARGRERLALVGKMATTIAHDIRSPLSVIAGYAQLLGELYPDGREHAEVIVAEVERLSGMVTELLEFAHRVEGEGGADEPALELRTYDLGAFLFELLRLVERDFQMGGIPILTRIDYHGPVRLDRNRLLRACLNISNNALEAIGSRGTFTIGARLVGNDVELSFTDTGPGIAPAIRAHLFEPFVAHGKDAGTGLGLAIARRIVAAHGGSIACAPGPGGLGTTFAIRLPAPPGALALEAAAAAAAAAARSAGGRGAARAGAALGPDDTAAGHLIVAPPPVPAPPA